MPSAFVRLRLVCCYWRYSRREILSAKSPGPTSTVKVEAAGDGGTTLTGADGLYNGRSVSRQNQPPLRTRLKYGASAPAVVGPSPELGYSEIHGQKNWVARMRRLVQSRSVCNSERSARERGRARGGLKTVRPSARTRSLIIGLAACITKSRERTQAAHVIWQCRRAGPPASLSSGVSSYVSAHSVQVAPGRSANSDVHFVGYSRNFVANSE